MASLAAVRSGGALSGLRRLLPSGNPLAEDVLAHRHRLLTRLLIAHIPLVLIIGALRDRSGESVVLALPYLGFLVVALLMPDLNVPFLARGARTPYLRLGALAVSAGLAWSSYAVIAISGGNVEAHLHLLLMVSAVALYQDGVAFLAFIGATTVLLELTSSLHPSWLYGAANYRARNPFLLSSLDLIAVVGVGIGLVTFWRATEQQTRQAADLGSQLERAELETAQAHDSRRRSTAALMTHLARRNQSLLARQITQLARLDATRSPIEVGELQHLAVRMRRNAESLLVLSEEDAKRGWGRSETVSTVLRRVASTASNQQAVELLLRVDATVAGRATNDLVHILEELLDNALRASNGTPVTVEAGRAIDGSYLIVVVDRGRGLDAGSLVVANRVLAEPVDLTRAHTDQLGFQVVGRLAARHHLAVSVAAGQAGGLVALIGVPEDLLSAAPAAPHVGA